MNYSFYLEALAALGRPSKAAEIREKAAELFGSGVIGGTDSVRNSMQRYIAQGRVRREGRGFYEFTGVELDPVRKLDAELRAAQTEIERLRELLRGYGHEI